MSEDKAEYGSKPVKTESTGYAHFFNKEYDANFNPLDHLLKLQVSPLQDFSEYTLPMPASEVQINNIVDEVSGDIPNESKANFYLKNCLEVLREMYPMKRISAPDFDNVYDLQYEIEEYLNSLKD